MPVFVVVLGGLIAFMSMAFRLRRWAHTRVLPHPALEWLPLGSPAVWLLGAAGTEAWLHFKVSRLELVPPEQRHLALTTTIERGLMALLVALTTATLVLAACFVWFSLKYPTRSDDRN